MNTLRHSWLFSLFLLSIQLTKVLVVKADIRNEARDLVNPYVADEYTQRSVQRTEVVVEARNFELPSNVQLNEENGNIAHLKAADVLGIPFRVPKDGLYRVELRLCNPLDLGSSFWVYDPATARVVFQIDDVVKTRDWNSWATVRLGMMELSEGDTELHLLVRVGGFNIQFMSLTLLSPSMAEYFRPTPLSGTLVIPATSFSSASDEVIIEAPMGGVASVGSIGNGAVLNYDIVDLALGSLYSFEFGLSSPTDWGHILVLDRTNDLVLAELVPVTDSDGWYTWKTVPLADTFRATDTTLSIQLVAVQGGFNLLFLSLIPASETIVVAANAASASNYRLFRWAADLTDFNGIQIEATHDWTGKAGPDQLSNLDDNDWFVYSLDVPQAGAYTLSMRVSSIWSGGSVDLIDYRKQTLLGTITDMPATGRWDSWTTVISAEPIRLQGGPLTFLMRVRIGGWNFLWFQLQEQDTNQ